eukprot:6014189-Heterocapsa_arctica.AAC.1
MESTTQVLVPGRKSRPPASPNTGVPHSGGMVHPSDAWKASGGGLLPFREPMEPPQGVTWGLLRCELLIHVLR